MLENKNKTKYDKGCVGKKQYRKYKEARDNIEEMRRKGRDVATLNIYLCTYCKTWHLGNTDAK